MNKPFKIGLTGGIGSGKSTIAKIFKSLGVPVFNSDEEARNIINNDSDTVKLITEEFGGVYLKGVLDSKKMDDFFKIIRGKYMATPLNLAGWEGMKKQC